MASSKLKLIKFCLSILIFTIFVGCSKETDKNDIPLIIDNDYLMNSELNLTSLNLSNVKLKDGNYVDNEGKITVKMDEYISFGNLTDDKIEDAAAIVSIKLGNNPFSNNLVVFYVSDNKILQTNLFFLGDKTQVKRLYIEDRKIFLDLLEADKNDPPCCPSKNVTKVFKLVNRTIAPIVNDYKSFNAFGSDSVWFAEITIDKIKFISAKSAEEFITVSTSYEDGNYIFEGEDYYKNKIKVNIKSGDCYKNSEENYRFTCEIDFKDSSYNGCAKEIKFEDIVNQINSLIKDKNIENSNFKYATKRLLNDNNRVIANFYRDTSNLTLVTETELINEKTQKERKYYFLNGKIIYFIEKFRVMEEPSSNYKGKNIEAIIYFSENEKVLYTIKKNSGIIVPFNRGEIDKILSHILELKRLAPIY